MSIHYSEKLSEMISNIFEPKFLEQGFKRSKNDFIRETEGIQQVCGVQKSRANSSIFASFHVGVSIRHPNFAKLKGIKL